MDNPAELTLKAALEHDEDLIAVLRSQLYIERALEDQIKKVVLNGDALLAEASFRVKIDVARRMGLIDKVLSSALIGVAELRNQFAHRLERAKLTEADDAKMFEFMKGETLHSLSKAFLSSGLYDAAAVGSTTRAPLLAIFVSLHLSDENR